jgi:hypothetical protein
VIGIVHCETPSARYTNERRARFEAPPQLKEINMINKTKTALVAALVLGSASVAFADDLPYTAEKSAYLRNPNAPIPTYNEQAPAYQPAAPAAVFRGQLIEGRNVGVQEQVPAEQKRSYDRSAIDFNS